MLRAIRKLNLVLFVLIVLCVPALLHSQPAEAAPAPFLYRPYYGSYQSHPATAWFDHDVPTPLTTNGHMTNRDNSTWFGWQHDISVTDGDGCDDVPHCYDSHEGNDLALYYEPVVASAPGQVFYAGWQFSNHESGLGLMTGVYHQAQDIITDYGHLSMVRYQPGNNVGRWQIGTSGRTGNADGAHLHFEVLKLTNDGYKYTDPWGWKAQNNDNDNGDDPWANSTDPIGTTSTYLFVSNPSQGNEPTYNGTYTVDDGDSAYGRGCASGQPFWHDEIGQGNGNDYDWTRNNGTTTDCYAQWSGNSLPTTGQYEVEVYVPAVQPDVDP